MCFYSSTVRNFVTLHLKQVGIKWRNKYAVNKLRMHDHKQKIIELGMLYFYYRKLDAVLEQCAKRIRGRFCKSVQDLNSRFPPTQVHYQIRIFPQNRTIVRHPSIVGRIVHYDITPNLIYNTLLSTPQHQWRTHCLT